MEGLGLLPEALLPKSGLERRKNHQSAARPGSSSSPTPCVDTDESLLPGWAPLLSLNSPGELTGSYQEWLNQLPWRKSSQCYQVTKEETYVKGLIISFSVCVGKGQTS